MHKQKIGIDVDGVLAEFTNRYRNICVSITGNANIPTFSTDWDFSNWNLSSEVHKEAWKILTDTPNFYYYLDVLDGVTMNNLTELVNKYTVYFITTRPSTAGDSIELQTTKWLRYKFGLYNPYVIVSKNKGKVANALELSAFIDDGPANIADLALNSPKTRIYLREQTYNTEVNYDCARVKTFDEFAIKLMENNG